MTEGITYACVVCGDYDPCDWCRNVLKGPTEKTYVDVQLPFESGQIE